MEVSPLPEWLDITHLESSAPYNGSVLENTSLSSLPSEVEEQIVVGDLIYCLAGVDGSYIRYGPDRKYAIMCDVRGTTASFISQVLPLCNDYRTTLVYSETHFDFDHGRVIHAFASALKSIIFEFQQMVAKLDAHKRLTLPLLIANLRLPTEVFAAVAQIIEQLSNLRGAQALSVLYQAYMSYRGSNQLRQMLRYLFQSSSVPLVEFVDKWICTGTIEDPFTEFFIQVNEMVSPEILGTEYESHFWERKYSIVENRVPSFLSRPVVHSILSAGKTAAVLSMCGLAAQQSQKFTLDGIQKIATIDSAAAITSRHLVDSLKRRYGLLEALETVRAVMLCGRGDLIHDFMLYIRPEMKKPKTSVHEQTIDVALEYIFPSDTFKLFHSILDDELLVDFVKRVHSVSVNNPTGIPQSSIALSSWDYLSMGFNFEWPLSLIFTSTIQSKYQLLFRTQIAWRLLERDISKQRRKPTKSRKIETAMFAIYQFVSSYISYISYVVIDPLWQSVNDQITNSKDIETVFKVHEGALDEALRGFFVSDPKVFSRMNLILFSCRQMLKELSVWRDTVHNTRGKERILLASPFFKYYSLFIQETKRLIQTLDIVASRGGNKFYSDFIALVNQNFVYSDL